jgi:oligopeptidase A
MTPTENPLAAPTQPLPFGRIGHRHVISAVNQLLTEADGALEALGANTAPATFSNTFAALEQATEPLEWAMGLVEHLESVATTPDFRSAYNAVLPKVSAFWSGLPLRAALYQRLRAFAETEAAQALGSIEKRFVRKTLDDFRRHGAELDEGQKQELSRVDQELSQLTTRFAQHVLDASNAFELIIDDDNKLAGLPASALAAARDSAQAKGKTGFRFTLQAPSVVAVLNYADSSELRETIWRAFNKRAAHGKFDNRSLVRDILRLRRKRAKLLGFENFADLVTQDRMAKSGQEARAFVQQLSERTRAAFERETQELIEFRRQLEGLADTQLNPWDVGYYAEKQRSSLYAFDEEQLRAYFPAERVLEGAFSIASRLFGINIEHQAKLPVWHPDVRTYRIQDASGRTLGVFYTDLYPRENKRDGAWMHGLMYGKGSQPHVALFCANANPPAGGKPSLLNHREVETVFHEFGHLLHHCLSKVAVRSLAGTRVAQDFVELPSQIMENWCSEKAALDTFAAHYETSEPVPGELVDSLIRARNFRAASAQMRQLGFAAVDLALHIDYDPDRDGDVNEYANRILQEYAPSKLPPDYALIASFSHLFSHSVGYAAGYYSYKWAEVLDADAFTRFQREGLFNSDVGGAFRDNVLAQGDSQDPMDLFKSFMGRPPELEAMLLRQGLGSTAPAPTA